MAEKNTKTKAPGLPPEARQGAKGGLMDLLLGSSPKESSGGSQAEAQATESAAKSGGMFDLLLGSSVLKGETKKEKTVAEKITDEEKEAEKRYSEGTQKVLDVIAPSGMEVNFKRITLGDGTICRTYFAYNWPSQIHPNWLAPVVNYEAPMDIAQFIYPSASEAVMKMLKRKVAEMRSSINIRREKGFARDPQLEAALEDAELLRDMLARGFEKLFQFGLYVTIYADSEEKMKKVEADLASILGGKLILMRPADFQMEHGWNSTLPFCLDELEINRNMNTSPLATSFPFSSSDLTSDKGILYGINRHNESLVIFDRFSLPNANSTVFASSGAGKSYAVKLEIIRSLMVDTTVFIIDPENEYTELAKVVGGGLVPLSLRSNYRINPFDLPQPIRKEVSAGNEEDEEGRPGELLRSAVINLHGLFKLMLGTVSPEQEAVLDKAILDTYALRNITLETADPGSLEPPTLPDLVDVLRTTAGGEEMAKVMEKFTTGSFAGLFNEKTNINLAAQLMVFQTRDLEQALRPMAIYVVLNYLWNEVRSSLKRRLIVVDEAWNIMQYEDSARFLYGLIKRARKYYLGITTITQDVEDFMNSPYGKPIVTNAAMQILLKQAPSAIKSLEEAFDLTEGEKYLLLNSGIGQGVFFAGRKHVALQIVASPKEHEIVTTNPEEIARRNAERTAAKDKVKESTESTQVRHAERSAEQQRSTESKHVASDQTASEIATKKESLFPEPPAKIEKKEEK